MFESEVSVLPDYELPIPAVLAAPPLPDAPPVLRLLELRFPGLPLYPRQIPNWRGAVVESAGRERDIFHNHQPEAGSVYRRPALIQYRCAGGQAALWGMNAGADALNRWLEHAPLQIRIDGRNGSLERVESRCVRHTLCFASAPKYYRLHDYLALNPDNYRRWLAERRLAGRIELLENALTAHLLAFCQAAGWWLNERLQTELVELHGYKQVQYHDVPLLAFQLTYRCNLDLPDGIALGKAVSHGFGVQWKAPAYFEND